jgi:hypothetical protein
VKKLTAVISFLLGAGMALAQNAPCPQPPNLLTVKVDATVNLDPTTNLYKYQYTLTNDAGSQQNLRAFALDFADSVSSVKTPSGWSHGFVRRRSTIAWAATAAADLPPGTPDQGQLPPLLSPIKPGASLSGFSFTSPKPPGPVKFYVTGETQIGVGTEEDAEMATQNCPQSVGSFLDLALVGSTQGPVNFIPVSIEIKPPVSAPVPVNPKEDGVTPVAILGTSSFDVTTIDPASLRLGPGGSAPQPNQVHTEDVNSDGIPDLVAQFPSQAIGARCNDTALFLTGMTVAGVPIQGSEAIQTVGCKAR